MMNFIAFILLIFGMWNLRDLFDKNSCDEDGFDCDDWDQDDYDD